MTGSNITPWQPTRTSSKLLALLILASSIVLRTSPKYSFLFVSLLFFTQKYLALNLLMEHLLPLTGERWAKLEPLIPPPKSAAISSRDRCVSKRFAGIDAHQMPLDERIEDPIPAPANFVC